MITANILDSSGNTIGQLNFPDGTSQDYINSQLALYTFQPAPLTPTQLATAAVKKASTYGASLMQQFAVQNIVAGIIPAGQAQPVADYLQSLSYYLINGSLYSAINEFNSLIADTSQTKTNLSPFVTNDILYSYLNQLQTFMSIALTVNPGS